MQHDLGDKMGRFRGRMLKAEAKLARVRESLGAVILWCEKRPTLRAPVGDAAGSCQCPNCVAAAVVAEALHAVVMG
jgi:xanthine/CO dehydrogenase XdhC/CoxF family maturation factor